MSQQYKLYYLIQKEKDCPQRLSITYYKKITSAAEFLFKIKNSPNAQGRLQIVKIFEKLNFNLNIESIIRVLTSKYKQHQCKEVLHLNNESSQAFPLF